MRGGICPECSEILVSDDRCDCGWTARKSGHKPVDPNHGKCSWKYPDGLRCSRDGAVSPTTGDGNWFCGWHFECATRGQKDDAPNGKSYREFYAREVEYARVFKPEYAEKRDMIDDFNRKIRDGRMAAANDF